MIHPAARDGYAAKAGSYVTGRPGYPEAIVAWLRSDLGLAAGKTVLDLGAGTGKFVPSLLATGAAVIAVEPVPAMRAQLAALYPAVAVYAGSADAIPLADARVDAVVCAQAFHWFATQQALAEIRRVLKPGGVLGLVWNDRDESVAWVANLVALTRAYAADVPNQRTGAWRRLFPADGFGPLRLQQFAHGHSGAPDAVIVERVLSTSYIAALPQQEQDAIVAQVRAIIATTPDLVDRDIVTFPYTTDAFSCTKS